MIEVGDDGNPRAVQVSGLRHGDKSLDEIHILEEVSPAAQVGSEAPHMLCEEPAQPAMACARVFDTVNL